MNSSKLLSADFFDGQLVAAEQHQQSKNQQKNLVTAMIQVAASQEAYQQQRIQAVQQQSNKQCPAAKPTTAAPVPIGKSSRARVAQKQQAAEEKQKDPQ